MAFIGTPLDTRNTFQSLQGKRFNGDGSTTAFTLDVAPSSTLDIEVFVGNVRQDPNSAYTLSGTTLTFTGAPPSGTNNIYVVHQAKSVGTIGIPDDTISARTLVTLDNSADHVLIEDATDGELKKALIPAASFAGIDDQSSSNDDQLTITDTAVVINEDSDDVDFRVESNAETDMIFADGGLSAVGINCSPNVEASNGGGDLSTSVYSFQVAGASGATGKVAIGSNGAANGYIGYSHVNSGGSNIVTSRIEGQMDTTTAGSEAGSLELYTMESGSITQRMKIAADGDILIAKTSLNATTTGHELKANGRVVHTENASGDVVMIINRQGDDGSLISFKQANSQEGVISVSGATVSYSTFCGSHWSRLADNSKPTILRGTVLDSIATLCDWYQVEYTKDGETLTEYIGALPDGKSVGDSHTVTVDDVEYTGIISKEENERSPMCKISDTEDSKAIYGVFLDWDVHDDKVNDMYVASLGSFVVRIHGDETVAIGDYLQSKGDGTAKVQADDILRASTIAKVTSTEKTHTYDDGSYCVPCTLHCG